MGTEGNRRLGAGGLGDEAGHGNDIGGRGERLPQRHGAVGRVAMVIDVLHHALVVEDAAGGVDLVAGRLQAGLAERTEVRRPRR